MLIIQNAYLWAKIIILFYFLGCVHNYEPVITSLIGIPNPVNPGEVVYLSCVASDDDQSSMLKSDDLQFNWEAAIGEFTVVIDSTIDTLVTGTDTSFNLNTIQMDSVIVWTAPEDSGYYSISCTVSDLFEGEDVYTINIKVE